MQDQDQPKSNISSKKIECHFLPLKGNLKTMIADIPDHWTCYKIKFFFSKIHEQSKTNFFPQHPKFYITGKHFEDHQYLTDYITEVPIKNIFFS